jgi:hypothetical protein
MMALEANLINSADFIIGKPFRAFLDIGGHYMTGWFLMQRYFPKASALKKASLAFIAGLSPDFDVLTPIPHRAGTHNLVYAGMMGLCFSACNYEDYFRTKNVRNIFDGIKDNARRIVTSRYAKIGLLGAVLHLSLDNLNPNIQKAAYDGVIIGLTYLQNRLNYRKEILL